MPRPSRVLVVEDDEVLRDTIAEVVADDGHEVRVASDGVEALEHVLGDWHPDLIILDVMMPRMDAYQFRERQIAASGVTPPRVLVLSAVTDVEAAARRLDADAWLGKPFTLDAIVATVDWLLGRRTPSTSPGSQMRNGPLPAPGR